MGSGVLKGKCQHAGAQRVSVCRNTEVIGGCGDLEAARTSFWKVTAEGSWADLEDWRVDAFSWRPQNLKGLSFLLHPLILLAIAVRVVFSVFWGVVYSL